MTILDRRPSYTNAWNEERTVPNRYVCRCLTDLNPAFSSIPIVAAGFGPQVFVGSLLSDEAG
jgi:hypothetical protein